RRQYEIYGYDASFEDDKGSDLNAVNEGLISVTPLHFDLTDRAGFDALESWNLGGLLEGLG
ncbi:MAG: 5'/3'-nucleotidase SurE, partial [Solirubrobacterales bacterium]